MSSKAYGIEDPRPRVLIVDDDFGAVFSLDSILATDFAVVSCTSGRRALQLVEGGEPFHVVCADYSMPEIDGLQILRKAATTAPGTGCVLLTGCDAFFNTGGVSGYYVIKKPFDPARLTRLLTELARVAELRRAAMPGSPPSWRRRSFA